MFRGPAGLASLLKDGSRHYQGNEEAVFRNIDACKKLGDILKACFGPTGMSKLVSNFIDKRFLTSDATTIVSELEVQHPAAKVLVLAAQMQTTEFGDGTNFTILLAAELLKQAEQQLTAGVHISSIIAGYQLALNKTMEIMGDQCIYTVNDIRDRNEMLSLCQPILCTKLRRVEPKIMELIVDACLAVMPEKPQHFNTDNVRVNKLEGGYLSQSFMVNGMVLAREPKTRVKELRNCKVCVLANALEMAKTEGTGTVLIKTADQLTSFSKTEENEMDTFIKGFADQGVQALIVGGHISSLGLHYLDKYNMLAVATPSKFDIKRFCRTLQIPALQRIGAPMAEEIGIAEFIGLQEYGSQLVTTVQAKDTKLSTIVLRGPTRALLDEVERAIDDAVSLFKACTKDGRFVAGAAACETELALKIQQYGATFSGMEQYPVERFGQALSTFCRIIAENAGQNAMESFAQIMSDHKLGKNSHGIDVTRISAPVTRDVTQSIEKVDESSAYCHLNFPVYDHYMTKRWAIRLAVDAALTVLRVDQIIMARPAGGPKLPNQGHWDAKDEQEPIA